MESIYWVMAWACHRKCKHCYEDRFRPYVRGALEAVLAEAERNAPRITANLPPEMTYLDLTDPRDDGTLPRKTGRIILSGGESLMDPVRERVTYPVIEALAAKYRDRGGVKIVVQTTGDLLTPAIVDDLLARGVWMISVASIDDYHVGLEGEAKQKAFIAKLTAMFEAAGMRQSGTASTNRKWLDEVGPLYSFFGASPDAWIGKIWPRGRGWQNGLSTATLADNFCARWPIGNLTEEGLIEILDSLAGDPVYEALTAGQPQRMGLSDGWSIETFLEKSRTTDPKGKPYANLCIGCDRFHDEVLKPRIEAAAARRRKLRVAAE